MVEPAGPTSGDGTEPGGARRSWTSDPMPAGPPDAPPSDPATAPTDPAFPLPPGSWADPPAPTTPYFHDVSGYPAPGAAPAPPAVPAWSDGTAPGGPGPYPSSGYAPPAYAPPAYGAPYGYGSPYGPYAYGAYAPPTNNGLAIASMVCGIIGLAFCQVFAIPALIMGIVARRQINSSGGTQIGGGFAIAGIITGAIAVFLLVLLILMYLGMFAFMFTLG